MSNDSKDQPLPLEGIRVLAIEQMQAIPMATQLLTHLGAEVVKVEHPVHGESGRTSAPQLPDSDGNLVGSTYIRNNLNKKSVGIDLKHPRAVELITGLVPKFDVVAENFKAGTMERLGLGYDVLAAANPALVYVSVSGFGHSPGPYAEWPAYSVVAEAMGGLNTFRPEPGRYPNIGVAGAVGDNTSGLYAVIGVLSALRHAERSGVGQKVDIAMFDAMVAMMDTVPFNPSVGVHDNSVRAWPGISTFFQANDGLFVAQVGREHQFERFAEAVGHPEWLSDERFSTRQGWASNLDDVIRPAVESWAANMSKLDASKALAAAGVVAGPCFDADDIVADEHVANHNMILSVPRPDTGEPIHFVGNPVKLSRTAEKAPVRWPELGQHTKEILSTELGLSDDELSALKADGAIAG